MARYGPRVHVGGHRWEPTATTHRLQLLAGGYLLLAGLFELVLATLSHDYVRRSTLAAVQSQEGGMSAVQLRQVVELSVGIGVGVAIAVALVYVVLGLLTVAMRPPWLFYADMVVLVLVALGVPVAVAGLLSGDAGPPAFLVPNLLLSVLALLLAVWMVAVLVRVGTWACRRTENR